jgi:hypothetical protein
MDFRLQSARKRGCHLPYGIVFASSTGNPAAARSPPDQLCHRHALGAAFPLILIVAGMGTMGLFHLGNHADLVGS